MKTLGNWLIGLIMVGTLTLWVISKVDVNEIWLTPWLSASQLLSLLGTVLMSVTFVLSSRAKWLEDVFGGLDKVMRIHHIAGGLSFLMIINHPLFMAIDALPNFKIAAKFFWFSETNNYNLGVGALYTLILTLIATFLIKLPYNFWLKTHDLMGVVLILASLHIYTISSDVSRFMPLRMWIFLWLATGMFSFVYKIFLYKGLGPRFKYSVKEIKKLGDVVEIYLESKSEKLRFLPGQFVFVNFNRQDYKELHPFTISSSPSNEVIRLSVKILGDYTFKLRNLGIGVDSNLWGPYGRFYKSMERKEDVVMIAGGIGITPFLSILNNEVDKIGSRKMGLFYGANSTEDAVYDNEITSLQNKLVNFDYYRHFGDNSSRINIEILKDKIGELANKIFLICGPPNMMENLTKQLEKSGVKSNNIYAEDFSFKT